MINNNTLEKIENPYEHLDGVIVYERPHYSVRIRDGFEGWQAGFTIGVQTLWVQSNINAAPEENTKEYAEWMAENINAALGNLVTMTVEGKPSVNSSIKEK